MRSLWSTGRTCICQEIAKSNNEPSFNRKRPMETRDESGESTTQPLTSTNWQRSSKRNARRAERSGRVIELQGEHKKTATSVLRKNGYNVEVR